MIIYGAGMAGLLAGNMLRRFNPVIFESQSELPNNHAALLRFRSDIASKATHIPFKKVKVDKLISCDNEIHDRPNLKFTNMYSEKVTGKIMGRSINNLDPVERYIAPPNFIELMSNGVKIEYGTALDAGSLEYDGAVISTIPMNIMMDIVKWPDKPEFNYSTIWTISGEIERPHTCVYQTIYYPDPDFPFYRVSITGNTIIAESTFNVRDFGWELSQLLREDFGIISSETSNCSRLDFESNLQVKEQKYGKLLPIDEKSRKEFITFLTDKYNIYSLGRFATWRQILLDDIVKDVNIIEQMVECRDDYSRKLLNNGVRK